MKKNFLLLILLLVGIILVGCVKKPANGEDDEIEYNLMGADFIILNDNGNKADPRHNTYERMYKEEKIARIEYVEQKYNVKVVYKTYPSQASWGGARERYIINNAISGEAPAHVYEIPSYSVATLALAGAISPLTKYIEEFGDPLAWPEKAQFGTVMGEMYSYDDQYPVADEGIYYNQDLLARLLGDSRKDEPSKLWLEGKWNWETFEALADELNGLLTGEDQYVMGGRTYNWAYQFLGANGVHIVNNDLHPELDKAEAIETVEYLHRLYSKPGMWRAESPLSDADEPEFNAGKIVFHNGQSYWITAPNKWRDKTFKNIGFVPYPTGPNTKDDLSNYYINDVYGKINYVISSSFSKDAIPEEYQNMRIHDEIIFKIWKDLQYFPEKDEETGYASITQYLAQFRLNRLEAYYADLNSIDAHLSIATKAYPDYFYSMSEANNHVEGAYMLQIEDAIKNGDVRAKLLSLTQQIKATLTEKFKLDEDYFG